MWKIALGFVVFAGLAMFVIQKGGDKLDMGGEKHGDEAIHAPAPGTSGAAHAAPATASSAAAPVEAASASAAAKH